MRKKTRDAITPWLLLTLGILWFALTGLCTLRWALSRDEYRGFAPLALFTVLLGCLPFFMGLRSIAGPRRAGLFLTPLAALACLGGLIFGSLLIGSGAGGPGLLVLLLFFVGIPGAFLWWGLMMLRSAPPPAD